MKKFSEQEIQAAFQSIPKQVQEMLVDGIQIAETIGDIGMELRLHIDLIGSIAELNRNMLLGLVSPTEFGSELSASGVDTETVKKITEEINQKIFIPLREKMKSAKTGSAPTAIPGTKEPARSREVVVPMRQSSPRPVSPTPIQPRTMPRDIAEIRGQPLPPRTMPSLRPAPAAAEPLAISKPQPPPAPPSNQTTSATLQPPRPPQMTRSAPLPPMSPSPSVPTLQKRTTIYGSAPTRSSETVGGIPPTNLPGIVESQNNQMPRVELPVSLPPPIPTPQSSTNPAPPKPLVKEYGSDPYREPVQ